MSSRLVFSDEGFGPFHSEVLLMLFLQLHVREWCSSVVGSEIHEAKR